jgi:inorganic pyrophosphatase
MDIESWLEGYDHRKHDLLGWIRDGGDALSGAANLVSDLERTLAEIRGRVQADAAAADLARLDAVLGGDPVMSEPAAAPEAVQVAPVVPAFETAEVTRPTAAAEGILKSLSWMDKQSPETAPSPPTRSRIAARPAALDFLGSPSTPSEQVAEAPPAQPAPPAPPTPAPVEPAIAASAEPTLVEPTLLEPSPVVPRHIEATPLAPLPMEPAPVMPTPVVAEPLAEAPLTAACPDFEPMPMSPREALAQFPDDPAEPPPPPITSSALDQIFSSASLGSAVAEEPAPPRRTQRPIVIDCPEGEERRAALEGVGAGPDVPYLLHAVVEVPRGGGTGYFYNDPKDVFVVVDHPGADDAVALGHVAYGFVPDTVSDDGAHLDTFVLSSGAAGPGEMLRVRPLGYLRRADGDHKLFCVPEKHRAQVMADIPDAALKACETWRNPTGVSGGTWCDAGKARELVRRCMIA